MAFLRQSFVRCYRFYWTRVLTRRVLFACATVGASLAMLFTMGGATDSSVSPVEIGFITVEPSTFRQDVQREGLVEPLRTSAVYSDCHWTTTILSIVPEGTWVQKGDVVCVLDSADIEEFRQKREVTLIKYRGRLDRAVQDEQLLSAQNERRLAAAEYRYESAERELNEYRDGKVPQEVEELEKRLAVLTEQTESDADAMRHTEKLWAMGIVSQRVMENESYAYLKSSEQRRAVERSLRLLHDFTQPRVSLQLSTLRHDALSDFARVKLTNSLAITDARRDVLAWERRVHIYDGYYKRAVDSIAACTMVAPADGQILYGNSWYLKSRGITQIEEGKTVRRYQKVFEIPDTDRLKVSVPIDEALIYSIRERTPVTVTVPGADEESIAGEIFHIARYPKQRSSYTPNVKDYWVSIELLPTEEQKNLLKPKTNTVVNFTLSEQEQVLQIPRDAVTGVAGHNFVYVFDGRELVPRKVELGEANSEFVCVLGGLAAGDQLVTDMTDQHAARLTEQLRTDLAAAE